MLLFSLAVVLTGAAQVNPLSKVLGMLGELQDKLIAEGQEAQKMYGDFANWCQDRSQELHFEVKTGKAQVASLKAAIDKGSADSQALESKISDGASDISEDEGELKEATGIRNGENKAFVELEKELVSTVDMLERSISVIEKEMKGGAFLQTQKDSAQTVVQALKTLVEASSVSSLDASKLTALIQNSDSDEDDQMGAPSAAATENQSGGIVEVLQGLLDKAESQLDKARKQEQNAAQNYAMKKQSLQDSGKQATKELNAAKTGLSATKEKKAVNSGDLTSTKKDLREDLKELEELHHTCLGKATDFEEETKSRSEEIGALKKASKIIQETTGGATSQSYDLLEEGASFVQVASKSKMSSSGAGALRIIRRMAYKEHSAVLTQLASRIQSTLRFGSLDGASPFKKVQGMVMDMIANLEKDAEAEATEKDYCDKELSETNTKLDDKNDEAGKLSTKVDQMVGASQRLKGEVGTLQKELAAGAKTQGDMSQMRQKENAAYKKNKPEMEQGLNGVKLALKVLKEYYAKPAFVQVEAGSKGSNEIIGLLEVAESDFSKLLAEMIAEEEQAQASFDETTNENNVAKAAKEQDVKYKTREAAGLDKSSAEVKADLSGVSDELSAINDYHKQLKGRCTAKAPSYEKVAKRREEQIAGLKESLTTLEGGAFVQEGFSVEDGSHRTLRGINRA